jgi:Na+/melibiose symporter-like transporter
MDTHIDNRKIEEFLKHANGKDKEQVSGIQSQMKTGKIIALIGLFCPLFWIALFSGQSAGAVLFNFCHSMLFVILGLFMYFTKKRKLLEMIEEKEKGLTHKSKTSEK